MILRSSAFLKIKLVYRHLIRLNKYPVLTVFPPVLSLTYFTSDKYLNFPAPYKQVLPELSILVVLKTKADLQ